MLQGVYSAKKKDNTLYYRSNITFKGKHISLGSFKTEEDAHHAYLEALHIITTNNLTLEKELKKPHLLSFEKIIILINFKNNKLYVPTPIYLRNKYFSYYLSSQEELKFDIDDLFYYSSHKILRRNGRLYVNDYGMQVTLLSRYGIKNHAVAGKDYSFINGDNMDYRYSNIVIHNPYYGVNKITRNSKTLYCAKIHINGMYTIGNYTTLIKAAIAYNKAVDLAKKAGINKNFPENYIETITAKDYADIYTGLKLSPKFMNYLEKLPK